MPPQSGSPEETFFTDPRLPFFEGRLTRNSSRCFKAHMHRSFSIGVVLEGTIRYRVDRTDHTLLPGALALINPETLHACNPGPSGSRSFAMLYLETAWCLELQQDLWQTTGFLPVRSALLTDPALYACVLHLLELLQQTTDPLEQEQELVYLVSRVFSLACQPGASRVQPPLRIDRLKKRLAHNLDQELTLSQLAAEFGRNSCTLIRQFKEATGMPPHAYRMNCRINQARQLLQQGMDIGEAALACGFYDQSHLHRHFRAMTTSTPKQYQQHFQPSPSSL